MLSLPSTLLALVGSSVSLVPPGPPLELRVDPPAGFPSDTFEIRITNTGTEDVPYINCCTLPRITSLADGHELFCPVCPPGICPQDPALLPPGESLVFRWRPLEGCGPAPLLPGLYEVRWAKFPDTVVARLELLPDPETRLEVTAEPADVRYGGTLLLTVANHLQAPVGHDLCCNPPVVLDPAGRPALCCKDCAPTQELPPDAVEGLIWRIGDEVACNPESFLPGIYRAIWNFYILPLADGSRLASGETTFRVLPPLDSRLELSLSANQARPGDLLAITVTNPLDRPVQHQQVPGCQEVILLDPLGTLGICGDCPPEDPKAPVEEIPPGGSITTLLTIPALACGQIQGRWSVIWGRTVVHGIDGLPIWGYAEIDVLPQGSGRTFVRGDVNGDGTRNLSDPIFLLVHLFLGGEAPGCLDAGDANDDGSLEITDAIYSLSFQFLGGPPPASPFPDCGPDPTPDGLGCEAFACR